MNIYFAAPLFAKSDLLYNADLVNQIEAPIHKQISICHKKMHPLMISLLMLIVK